MRFCNALWLALIAVLTWSAPAWSQGAEGEVEAAATAAPSTADEGADASGEVTEGEEASAAEATQAEEAAEEGAKPAEAAAPPSGGGAAASEAEGEPIDGATYAVRMRDLAQRIDQLKEQIRRSHTRLSLLSDTILSGGVGGARARIKFVNDMSGAFRLTRALVVLDGAVQYNRQDTSGQLAARKEIPIFSGSVTPGDHTLQVVVELRGHGYGVFSYLRGYQFEVKGVHSFTVTEGKNIELDVVAFEKGGVTTPLEKRPGIRYVRRIKTGTPVSDKSGSSGKKAGVSGGFSVGTGGE